MNKTTNSQSDQTKGEFLSFAYLQAGGFIVLIPLLFMISFSHGRRFPGLKTNDEKEDDNFLSRFQEQRPQNSGLPVVLEAIEKNKRNSISCTCNAQAITNAMKKFAGSYKERKEICQLGGLCCKPIRLSNNDKKPESKCATCKTCDFKKMKF